MGATVFLIATFHITLCFAINENVNELHTLRTEAKYVCADIYLCVCKSVCESDVCVSFFSLALLPRQATAYSILVDTSLAGKETRQIKTYHTHTHNYTDLHIHIYVYVPLFVFWLSLDDFFLCVLCRFHNL